jgi:hypothetical protein
MKTVVSVSAIVAIALAAGVGTGRAAYAWGLPSVVDIKNGAANLDEKRLEGQREIDRRARDLDRQRQDFQRQLETRLLEARSKVRECVSFSSNKGQVQAALREGGWQVAFGKEIDYAEYEKFCAAVALAIATDNPSPVLAYIQYLVAQTKVEIMRSLNAEARRTLANLEMQIVAALDRAIKTGQITEIRFGGMDVRIGIATYNHWKSVSGNYPKIDRRSITWEHLENRIPLPNTHQPYVAYRFRYTLR